MSRCTRGGSEVSNIRCVSTITVRSCAGSTRHDVPKPPSHPNAPDCRTPPDRSPTTGASKNPGPSPPCAFCPSVSWSVAHRAAPKPRRQHGAPPASSIRANASRSSAVRHEPARAVGERRRAAPRAVGLVPRDQALGLHGDRRWRDGPCRVSRTRCPASPAARTGAAPSTSSNGSPAARATSTPSTDAPVLYSHRSPGWASSGSDPRPAIHVSGSGWQVGVGRADRRQVELLGGGDDRPRRAAAANISLTIPKPNVNVSRSRVVIARSAGTVSSSGPSIRVRTRRSASSGSSRSTGSSSPISPSSITASVAAAVIGLVVDAIRNSESRWTGAPPIASVPSASTRTSSPLRDERDEAGYARVADVRLGGRAYPFAQAHRDYRLTDAIPGFVVAVAGDLGQLGVDPREVLVGQLDVDRAGVLLEVARAASCPGSGRDRRPGPAPRRSPAGPA